MTAPDVIVIRGAPGVGKSATAKCLASHFPGGAKIEVDILRKMVISVDWKDQREHVMLLDAAACLAHYMAKCGFRPVIVVDTFSGDKVKRFLEVLRSLDTTCSSKVFALHATDAVLQRRLGLRPGDEFRDFGISQKLNADVLKVRYPGEVVVDATAGAPEQVAAVILEVLASRF